MNTKTVARDSYHLATRLEECPFDQFWVVLLDDATEVYQTEDDQKLVEPSAWMRLKLFCQEQGRKIVHMAYACRSNPALQVDATPDAEGYFFAKSIGTLLAANMSYEYRAVGIGSLLGNNLKITWRVEDGRLQEETRDITEKVPFTLIRN